MSRLHCISQWYILKRGNKSETIRFVSIDGNLGFRGTVVTSDSSNGITVSLPLLVFMRTVQIGPDSFARKLQRVLPSVVSASRNYSRADTFRNFISIVYTGVVEIFPHGDRCGKFALSTFAINSGTNKGSISFVSKFFLRLLD